MSIVRLYESSLTAMACSDDHLSMLFMCHVRVRNYKYARRCTPTCPRCRRQQQIASQLLKMCPSNHSYLFWTIISLVMQGVDDASGRLAASMFYPLAVKALDKALDKALPEGEAAAVGYKLQTLHVLVLHYARQYARLATLVALLDAHATLDVRGVFGWHPLTIHAAQRQYEHVIATCRKELETNVDDWPVYELLIETTMQRLRDDDDTANADEYVAMAERLARQYTWEVASSIPIHVAAW